MIRVYQVAHNTADLSTVVKNATFLTNFFACQCSNGSIKILKSSFSNFWFATSFLISWDKPF